MDPFKKWLIEQLKAEEPKSQTPRFWRLKDWLTRTSMAEFKSTELRFNPLMYSHINTANNGASVSELEKEKEVIDVQVKRFYEALVLPIKEEIREWEKK